MKSNNNPVSGRIFDLKYSRLSVEKGTSTSKMMHGENDYSTVLVFVVPRRSKNNNPFLGDFDLKSNRFFLEKELLLTFFENDAW